jgi:hypothetical protein
MRWSPAAPTRSSHKGSIPAEPSAALARPKTVKARSTRSTLAFLLLAFSFWPCLAAGVPDMSDAFQRFRYSFFEDPTSARDGLDLSSLAALEGDERKQAEILLLGFLPDARAVIGLGVLRSRAAEAKLTALFEAERKRQIEARDDARMRPGGDDEWYPSALLYLAQALWRIQPDSRWPQAAIEVLSSAPHWVFRQEAIQALDGVDEPIAAQALTNALDDADALVRHAAARGLLTLYGLPVDPADPQHMAIRVMSADAARRDKAKQDILAAIAGRTALRK